MTAKQIIQIFLILVILIFLAWLAFYFLVVALVIGGCAALFFGVRKFLIKHGIIKAPPPVSADIWEEEASAPEIIEVEYQVIKEKNEIS
jgi:hypothetical protein